MIIYKGNFESIVVFIVYAQNACVNYNFYAHGRTKEGAERGGVRPAQMKVIKKEEDLCQQRNM